jgi:hypothetical protein
VQGFVAAAHIKENYMPVSDRDSGIVTEYIASLEKACMALNTFLFIWWKLHMHTVGVKDEHGSSCATPLNTWLLNKLNEACGRAGNPVFNEAIPGTGQCKRA